MSTDLVADTGQVARAHARLLEQDRERPKLLALTSIAVEELQLIRAVLQDLYDLRNIDDATGVQLDALGWIVGEPRLNRADELYRIWIRIRIIANRSSGRIVDSFRVVRLLIESTATVTYAEDDAASYVIELTGTVFDLTLAHRILDLVRPAGVKLSVHISADNAHAFTLGAVSDVTNASNFGLSSLADPTYGGTLTTIG